MHRRRLLLLAAAVALAIPTFFFATSDVLVRSTNCGTALVPRDIDMLVVESGDILDDDFTLEALRDECAFHIERNRILTAILAISTVALYVASKRVRPPRPPIPGDPIV